MTRANPLPLDAGARDTAQYSYFIGAEGLKLLEPFANCIGPKYQANRAALEGMRDRGKAACEQLSSATGTCVPKTPFIGTSAPAPAAARDDLDTRCVTNNGSSKQCMCYRWRQKKDYGDGKSFQQYSPDNHAWCAADGY